MDLINNLLYTALNATPVSPSGEIPKIDRKFISLPVFSDPKPVAVKNFYAFEMAEKEQFCSFDDSDFIEDAIQKHWSDVVFGRNYTDPIVADEPQSPNTKDRYFSIFRKLGTTNLIPPYHLIYAYLVENTRIAQIFEKLLYLYMHDEKLTKATSTPTSIGNRIAFQWMMNTESLFFKHLSNNSYRNISSMIRSNPEATRRNAYYRMFGMDLAFGDSQTNASIPYYKAEFNNQPFIILFEKFLTEIWQAYTNAKNTSGQNTTDMFNIVDTAQKIQEMLMSRRTTQPDFNFYRYFNLSKEEYASVVMMSWLYEVVSYDSPLIDFLRCNGNTPGERLINIGNKVSLPAHSKSEGLLDIAPVMNTLLRRIEFGDYNISEAVRRIIMSQTSEAQTLISPITIDETQALDHLLLIINNWEKATGHRIKNPEANITGSVKVQQNGMKAQPAMN